MKHDWKPGSMIYPLPVVMISYGKDPEEHNIFTVSWIGTLSSDPPYCYISVKPRRNAHRIIKKDMEFVINLVSKDLSQSADYSGVVSGREHRKFEELNLTPELGRVVKVPLIKESPINIECKVKTIVSLGSHDVFIAEVMNIKVCDSLIDEKTGKIDLHRANLITFSYGKYFELGEIIGEYGWSKRMED